MSSLLKCCTRFVILFLTGFCWTFAVEAQYLIKPKCREKAIVTAPKEKFHLYLLIGQSNMAGRGTVEPEDTVGNLRILRLNKQGEWEMAKDPVHFDKPAAGVGPGLAFAREMLDLDDDIVIGLIPCAIGGSSIDCWKADVFWKQTNSYPYNDAVSRTKRAMESGVLKGILWHQGEADLLPEKTAMYKEKISELIVSLREELHTPSVPFIAGEIAEYLSNNAGINKILHEAKMNILYYDVVSAKGLTAMPDGIHFDTRSGRELGKRYAEKMKKMYNK